MTRKEAFDALHRIRVEMEQALRRGSVDHVFVSRERLTRWQQDISEALREVDR